MIQGTGDKSTSIPGKFMEQVLLEAMSRQMKKVGDNSQHRLTRDIPCLAKLDAF